MCSLLVEVTIPPSSASGRELFHQSAEDAYESALHHVLSPEAHKDVWREYIYYVRSKGVKSAQGFRKLRDCVQRCVLDVTWKHPMPRPQQQAVEAGSGASSHQSPAEKLFEDYTFHNEVTSVVREQVFWCVWYMLLYAWLSQTSCLC